MNEFYLKQQTKTIIWLLAPFFFITALSAQPVIGTTTFDGDNSSIVSNERFPINGSVQGWFFYADGSISGSIYHSGASDLSYVSFSAPYGLTEISIRSYDYSEFNLDHIIMEWFSFSGDFTMTSYRDGNIVGSVTLNAISNYFTDYDLSSNTDFDNIDKIILSGFNNSKASLYIDEITISAPSLSIEGIDNNSSNISIHPNPSSDYITVKNIDNIVNYQVIDLNGVIVMKGRVNQSDNRINLTGLSSGLFILKIDEQQPVKILKI